MGQQSWELERDALLAKIEEHEWESKIARAREAETLRFPFSFSDADADTMPARNLTELSTRPPQLAARSTHSAEPGPPSHLVSAECVRLTVRRAG
jgi:hypothetical protein